jgi:hypothetical protein
MKDQLKAACHEVDILRARLSATNDARAAIDAARAEAERAKAELKATREYAETSDQQSDLRLQTILDLERKLAALLGKRAR